jgi:hypothetical protein
MAIHVTIGLKGQVDDSEVVNSRRPASDCHGAQDEVQQGEYNTADDYHQQKMLQIKLSHSAIC